jgi:hypothetical protein
MDKYICEICNYRTDRKFCLDKHLTSSKHMNNMKRNKNQQEIEIKDIIISTMKTQFDTLQNEIVSLKDSIKSNTSGDYVMTHSNNTTNSHNNTFNLQLFLNETCKNAMNIDEFVKSIDVGIQDLKYLGRNGYVEAMSSLIIDNLNKLDVTERPMHCSDVKRENIFVRMNNVWEKENEEKKRTHSLIREVQRSNTRALQEKYQQEYPQCMSDYDSKEHKEYGDIAYQAFGGKYDCDDLNKKIIRRIVNKIGIDKSQIYK